MTKSHLDDFERGHPVAQAGPVDKIEIERHADGAGHDQAEAAAGQTGRVQGGLGDADDRHAEQLPRRMGAGIERHRDDHRVTTGTVGGDQVERGVAGDGIFRRGRDDRDTEIGGDADDLGARARAAQASRTTLSVTALVVLGLASRSSTGRPKRSRWPAVRYAC